MAEAYVTNDDFKASVDLTGFTFADTDVTGAILGSSIAIDEICGRRFYDDANASQVRYYTPARADVIAIHDLITLTSIELDDDDDGTYETALSSGQYVLEPPNALADGKPWTHIRLRPTSSVHFSSYPQSVKVTGKFGWAAVPQPIVEATKIIAAQVLRRKREAPFGVVNVGLDGGAVYIARSDPQVQILLEPYVRLDPDE